MDGHEYARDRAPRDDPIGFTAWRYRWSCSCGAAGHWQDDYPITESYRDWRKHQANLRDRSVPRSTTHRTTS